MNSTMEQISRVTEHPNIHALQEEYQTAWNDDPNIMERIAQAEAIRYTRWPGQTADGLKHQDAMPEGVRAMPYDRAPDCRVNLADTIIQGLVDRDYVSFWSARVKTSPAAATRLSGAQAGELRTLMSWMIHGPLRSALVDQVEFASQVMRTIGWVVLHPIWRRKTQLRRREVSMEGIVGLAQSAPPDSVLSLMPALILDPTTENEAAQLLRQFVPSLKQSRAERVIRELREDGQAEFPAPDTVQNVPELAVLVPWQDFILPAEATASPGTARMMFRRKFFTEAALETEAQEEAWDPDFVAAAKSTKGQAMENGLSAEHAADRQMQLIECVYGFRRMVDDDGVPGIYCTVFSPHVREQAYGAHWLVDLAHGEYPFLFLTTEVTGRRPSDARGVPDVLQTQQNEMKQQRDATYVYSQLSVTPPLQKRSSQASRLPPELGPLGIINTPSGNDWSWFPPPPGKPEVAFKLIEDVRKEAEDYYGEARLETPPGKWQTRQQRQTMRWLAPWGEAFWQLAVLAYQHLEPHELEAIFSRAPLLNADMVARHRLLLWFDVRALNPEWVEFLLKTIAELVLPGDSGGVVDRSKLTQFALGYLDPTLAEEVTTDEAGARQALFKGVRDEIGSIMQGNEGLYVENDATAKAKLLFAQQIIANNPDYQVELSERSRQFNPRKRERLEKWLKNLGQSAVQQDNKVIGRLGVKPEAPALNY